MTPNLQAAMDKDARVIAAYIFALAAHGAVGQMRPTLEDPNVPYIVHPIAVAEIVAGVPGISIEAVIAALLHDVLEDTKVSILTIRRLFGAIVADYVLHLTDYYTPERFPNFNRAARKRLEAIRYADTPVEVKTIKLADGLDNTPSIALNKPKFMPTYGPEKRNLIEFLVGGDAGLWLQLDATLFGLGY